MKINQPMLPMLLISVIFTANQAYAETPWWQKAIEVFSSPSSEITSEATTLITGNEEISAAFKEALRIGAENVVGQLGSPDGFNADPNIHIALPKELDSAKILLAQIGMEPIVDDLELKLNRAAELATPKAKQLFLDAINTMSFDDVQRIYNGPENSATTYFKEKMSPSLSLEMRPIITDSLAEVGAVQAYDSVVGEYQDLPFVPDIKGNLSEYVEQEAINGIFYYLGQQEAAIRSDPLKQSTKLLKDVFGSGN